MGDIKIYCGADKYLAVEVFYEKDVEPRISCHTGHGYTVPMRTLQGQGHEHSIGAKAVTHETWDQFVINIQPLVDRVKAGWTVTWNGDYRVSKYSDDACDALSDIRGLIEGYDWGSGVLMKDAGKWVGYTARYTDKDGVVCKFHESPTSVSIEVSHTISPATSDADLDVIVAGIEGEAGRDDIVLTDAARFIYYLRDRVRDTVNESSESKGGKS